ncbi:hypothetical protein H663_018625 [Limnohabitans planktonicus II-D5]|uniref:Uncharacterized protein n=1 Tax=Limnohabitans planktonicus II-D5 TaxID=1293045 RepID=A0A2T7U953_9BURK|nr:hypothetical protein H663_018625 [Limnohabitans planktonicus II-D5]
MVFPAATLMVMVSPGVPLPLRVGVVSVVMVSVSKPLLLLGESMAAGALGAAVSTTMVMGNWAVVLAPVGLVSSTPLSLVLARVAVRSVGAGASRKLKDWAFLV